MGRSQQSVRNCRTPRQFQRAVRKQGGYVEGGGRHDKLCGPNGGKVPLPRHSGDLPTGTRSSIAKALLAIGFLVCLCTTVYSIAAAIGYYF